MRNAEQMQDLVRQHREAAMSSAQNCVECFQAAAAAHSDHVKKSLQEAGAFIEKMTRVESLDKAIDIDTEYRTDVYEAFVAQSKKMADVYIEFAKTAFKSFEGVAVKPVGSN